MDVSTEAVDTTNNLHPKRLSTTALVSKLVLIDKDRLTVKYKGSSQHANDVGAVRSDHPVPLHQKMYYYEIKILKSGETNAVSIGFASEDFKLQRHPGWEANSFGYHGSNGRAYTGNSTGKEYGPQFGQGDVIGAGMHLEKQQIFFTKNGKFLEVAFTGVYGKLYPTIGLHSVGDWVEANFGQKPFVFDLDGMIQDEEAKMQSEIQEICVSSATVHGIIRQYLMHYGYGSTLSAFDEFCGIRSSESNSMDVVESEDIERRMHLRNEIVQGRPDKALEFLRRECKHVQPKSVDIFDLRCILDAQIFIEMVREHKIETAVEFAQKEFRTHTDNVMRNVQLEKQEVLSLVAYEDPSQSPMKHLLSIQRREYVADVVNDAFLKSAPNPDGSVHLTTDRPNSSMEKLLKQLVATHNQLLEENRNQGEVFDLRTYF